MRGYAANQAYRKIAAEEADKAIRIYAEAAGKVDFGTRKRV